MATSAVSFDATENMMDDIRTDTNLDSSSSTSIEDISNNHVDDNQIERNDDEVEEVVQTGVPTMNIQTNEPTVLKVNQINTDIDFVWKIQGVITYKHPKRTYSSTNGTGETSTWDLMDDTGSVNLVAFNLNSNLMSNKLKEGKSYEFKQLSIRSVDDVYKTLPHEFQLIVTNSTNVKEIVFNLPMNYEHSFNFTNLNEVEALPLNSIIDVDVLVLRDYGTTVGTTNNNSWSRRELHVAQDGVHIRLTLWNDKAKIIRTSMVNNRLKIKNVKVSWFNGTRVLATLGNTRLSVL